MAKKLLQLNGLATLGVVLNHAASWGFIAMFWWTDRYLPVSVPNFEQLGSFPYYVLRLIEQIISFSVPTFLFVSGFFIAFVTSRNQARERWKVGGVRIKTLVIPYLIWSVVFFLGDYLQGHVLSPGEYLQQLLTGGATPAYYYIPLIAQLYLLSPLIIPLAKNRWKLLLVVSAILQLGVQSLRYPYFLGVQTPLLSRLITLTPGWFFPGKVFWFTFGTVVGVHLQPFKAWITRYRKGLLALLVLLLPLGMLEWEMLLRLSPQDWLAYYDTGLDSLYAGVFIMFFLAFDRFSLPLSKSFISLGGKSYGVYLIHSLVLLYSAKAVYHLLPGMLGNQAILQPLFIVLGLGIPVAMMTVIKKSPGRVAYQYLFG